MIAIAVVLVVWIAAVLFAERLFLWPTRDAIPTHAERRLLAHGIEVWVANAQANPRAIVLRFYGNADRAERWIDGEAQGLSGIEVWGVSYPGFGGSEGNASLKGVALAADTAAAAAFARAAGRPVIVFGTSMGTAAALRVAAEHPVRGVFIHNPPALREMVRGELGWWNLWLLAGPVSWRIPRALDSIANARAAKADAVFALSGDDEIVPPKYQRLVEAVYSGEKRTIVMPGRRHNDPLSDEVHAALRQALVRWTSVE